MSWVSNDLLPELCFCLGKAGEHSHEWWSSTPGWQGLAGGRGGWWPAAGNAACLDKGSSVWAGLEWEQTLAKPLCTSVLFPVFSLLVCLGCKVCGRGTLSVMRWKSKMISEQDPWTSSYYGSSSKGAKQLSNEADEFVLISSPTYIQTFR